MSVIQRGGTWHLRRRVPKRFEAVEPRRDLWVSLHTDSRGAAVAKAASVWNELIVGWEARLAGNDPDAAVRLKAARSLAAIKGHAYLGAAAVAELPLEDILSRIEAAAPANVDPDPALASALLGGAGDHRMTLSQALDAYWDIAKDRILRKSDDQRRRWRNPRIKAFRNLIEIVGDKPVASLTRDDALAFRDWWLERLQEEGLRVGTADKDFTHIKGVLRAVVEGHRLDVDLPLAHLRIVGVTDAEKPRLPFSVEWIRTRLLAPDALGRLNPEARGILLGMINTGYRPSEGAGLTGGTIRLDTDVPHISIEPDPDRELKNASSRRVIPLAGVSLEAFRDHRDGFPTYRDRPSNLSATINKYLRVNGLKETSEHSLYGLRHSFEDRLLEADVDERIRRDLMGHSLGDRQRYGWGGSMEKRLESVRRIAL